MMNVLFLTRYDRNGASSRYRFFQYIDYLKINGFVCDILPLLDQQYLYYLYGGSYLKYIYALKGIFRRLLILIKPNLHYDLIVIEKELFPYIPFFLEKKAYPH